MSSSLFRFSLMVLSLLVFLPSTGLGQLQPATISPSPGSPVTLRIFALKYSAATNVVTMLRKVLEGDKELGSELRIVADPSTNRLILNGTKEQIELAQTLIEQIDQPAKHSNEGELTIMRMVNQVSFFDDDGLVLKESGQLFGLSIGVYKNLKMVVCRGKEEQLEKWDIFLQELDKLTREDSPHGSSFILRVMVLAAHDAPLAEPPKDRQIAEISERLSKLGLQNLQSLGQFLIHCKVSNKSARFQSQGQIVVDSLPAKVSIDGQLATPIDPHSNRFQSAVKIRIEGKDMDGESTMLASVGADLELTIGKTTLVAASPVTQSGTVPAEGAQMVFVVQLLPDEEH